MRSTFGRMQKYYNFIITFSICKLVINYEGRRSQPNVSNLLRKSNYVFYLKRENF